MKMNPKSNESGAGSSASCCVKSNTDSCPGKVIATLSIKASFACRLLPLLATFGGNLFALIAQKQKEADKQKKKDKKSQAEQSESPETIPLRSISQ